MMLKPSSLSVLVAVVLAAASPLCYGAEFRRAATLEDAFAASCRVSVANARGTGTFIGVDTEKNRAVVLTNYHVVTTSTTATLDFWTNSKQESVRGEVIARFYDARRPADFALIAVDPDELAKINPPFVALAGADAAPAENSFIMSAGCPKGRFVQAWKGRTLSYYNGATVQFKPGPVPGQSGSGVLSYVDGELWLTAVLTWLIGTEGADDSTGGAIPVANLFASLTGYRAALEADDPIPPDAKECAAVETPCVLFFYQKDCPPCEDARADVNLLKAFDVNVYEYDVDSETGSNLVDRFQLDATPSFVLLGKERQTLGTWTGAGRASDILNILKRQPAPSSRAPELVPVSSTPPDYTSSESRSTTTNRRDAGTSDFRNRPPVYEINDVGFFEDSDRRWRDRLAPKSSPDDDSRADRNEDDESEPGTATRPRLGDATSTVGKALEKTLDKKANELAARFGARLHAMRFRLTMALCFMLAVALLIAEGIAAGVRALWRKVRAKVAAALLVAVQTTHSKEDEQ